MKQIIPDVFTNPDKEFVQQTQAIKSKKLLSTIRLKPGQHIFGLRIHTGEIFEAIFEDSNTYRLDLSSRSLITEDNIVYDVALNRKNFIKETAEKRTYQFKESIIYKPVIMAKARSKVKTDNKSVQAVTEPGTINVVQQELVTITEEQAIEIEIVKLGRKSVVSTLESLRLIADKLEIKDINDVEGYNKCEEFRIQAMKLRTGVDNKHKAVKSYYWNVGKALDVERNEIVALITPIEDTAKALSAKFEKWVKDKEDAERQVIVDRTNTRIASLAKYGVAMDIELLTNMSEALFDKELQLAKDNWFEAEQKKLVEKEIAATAAANLATEQKLLAQQQTDLKNEKLALIQAHAKELGYTIVRDDLVSYHDKSYSLAVTHETAISAVKNTLAETKKVVDAIKAEEDRLNDPELVEKRQIEEIRSAIMNIQLLTKTGITNEKAKEILATAQENLVRWKNYVIANILPDPEPVQPEVTLQTEEQHN